MCSWNFSKCRRIGIQNYKISLMSREQKANGVRDDDVARYLRGEKCADVVAKTRRKLARWQRLMISAGSLARFKSRPRLYPFCLASARHFLPPLSRHRLTQGYPSPMNPWTHPWPWRIMFRTDIWSDLVIILWTCYNPLIEKMFELNF